MRYRYIIPIVLLAAFLSTLSCKQESAGEVVTTTTHHVAEPVRKRCDLFTSYEQLKGRTLKLPAVGKLVNEDHHTVRGAKQPTTVTDGITAHMQASCDQLKAMGYLFNSCDHIYKAKYQREWTPAEAGGAIGSGAISTKPLLLEEMFLFNMHWSSFGRPPAGYKYLVTNVANGFSVVVAGGYEVGPSDTSFMGGISTETHYFLNSNNSTVTLKLARLVDQSLPLGPINCEVEL